ncbi:MAG: hypothetical protein LBU89_03760 [Fibromonadaceae bacterium]|jgi:hypothetical protein|nr:hypothetical protein [Fibromonadaceae bacterium]
MTCDTIPTQDSLCLIRQVCTDTIYRLNYDSLTVAVLKDSQTFYSNSFSNLMMLIAIILAVIGLPSIWHWQKAKMYNKEMNEEVSNARSSLNKIWKQIADTNLISAALHLENNDFLVHFTFLRNYFGIVFDNKLELDDDMLHDIKTLSSFVDEYMEIKGIAIPEADFLVSLDMLLYKSKEMKKEIHYNELSEIFKKLYGHYGKDEIKRVIEERTKEIKEGL